MPIYDPDLALMLATLIARSDFSDVNIPPTPYELAKDAQLPMLRLMTGKPESDN